MAGFEEGVSESPLNPKNRAAGPKSSCQGARENNENCSSLDQVIPNFQNQMKKSEKHFISPSVSAASKVASKKKILVERNENSSSSYVGSSDDGNTNLYGGFRLKPYDPLTNYLSPRPKFLRFNPNIKREILNRLEKKAKKELSCSVDFLKLGDEESSEDNIKDSYISHVTESVTNQQNEGNSEKEDEIVDSDSEEEEEEEEGEKESDEERKWCLKGVLKILLALIAYFLSTSYICSMNSSTPSSYQQAIWDSDDGYPIMQNQTHQIISKRLHETGFLVVNERDNYLESDEVGIEENGNVDNKEYIVEEALEDREINLDGRKEELVAIDENISDEIYEAVEIVDVESGFGFELEKFMQLEDTTNVEIVDDGGAYGMKTVKEASIGNNTDKIEPTEKSNEVLGDDEFESETDIFDRMFVVDNEMQEKEANDSTHLEEVKISVKHVQEEEVLNQLRDLDDMELFEEHIGSLEKSDISVHEVDNEMEEQDNEWELEITGRSTLFVIGLSVVSIFLTSLAFFYRSKKVISTSDEKSQPVEEKLTPEPPLAMERKVEFLAPTSINPLIKEVSRNRNHNNIHVPTVELLGEIVIGETRTNSFRRCGRKYETIESEESSATLFDEQSSLPQPLSSTHSLSMEFSNPTSDPRENFTAETKNFKKKGGKNGKAMTEVTPVRRSGRLRNRAAAMSP